MKVLRVLIAVWVVTTGGWWIHATVTRERQGAQVPNLVDAVNDEEPVITGVTLRMPPFQGAENHDMGMIEELLTPVFEQEGVGEVDGTG